MTTGHDILRFDLADRTGDVAFFHRTITDNHHFVHYLGILHKRYFHRGLAFDIHHLGLITHHRNLEDELAVRHFDCEPAIKIRDRPHRSTGHYDRGSNGGLIVRPVHDQTGYRRLGR